MDGQEKYLIPRRLDDMPQLFFWDADVAVIAIAFILLGGLFGLIIPGLILGVGIARAFSRLKHDGGKGMMVRFLYWYTPSDWWLKSRAASWQREFIG
ncbi:MAG: type IV conjugative transfer system protein TraL [Thiothrix sp.]|uniref:type IV conjugative transfer system protein TraL n=1 Tax=Thiothrix sp. TaxID=1032 RepID=UPI00261670C5|nr:type IV conjugative transfer system protein TraL [Thiothrix sp.]MDD5394853.1 type IV conjugative transfer system protein TraL [Thiothrix sp.]